MNFLAHAYLSFDDKEILVGNMISDFVKGKAQYDFIPGIRKGIVLHRLIDDYTDTHVATKQAKEIFRPHYRLFSAAIIDILYDHYLANDSHHFEKDYLDEFSKNVYQTLAEYTAHLPPRFLLAFTYMQSENWLKNYKEKEGIEKSIRGLVRRSSFLQDSETACLLFRQHYEELRECYNLFFEDVKYYANEQFRLLLK
jgi:acyl carrier protein phosphodiesterase